MPDLLLPRCSDRHPLALTLATQLHKPRTMHDADGRNTAPQQATTRITTDCKSVG
jgi:hypothetical protein